MKSLKKCEIYHIVNTNLLNATLKKIAGQLWFLSEDLLALVLFGNYLDDISNDKIVLSTNYLSLMTTLSVLLLSLVIHQRMSSSSSLF